MRRLGLMPLVNALANGWFRLLKGWQRMLGRSTTDVVYTDRYFTSEEGMTLASSAAVVGCLMEEFSPASVVDVGCGTAVYLAEWEKHGVEIRGYEWSTTALARARVDRSKLHQQDLTQELHPDRVFDLVICFEVAEHVPTASSRRIAMNVAGLGPLIAFSAAQPGQGGRDHVNEQPPEFWIDHFEALGFRFLRHRTERLRDSLRSRAVVWWLPLNLLVFEATSPP